MKPFTPAAAAFAVALAACNQPVTEIAPSEVASDVAAAESATPVTQATATAEPAAVSTPKQTGAQGSPPPESRDPQVVLAFWGLALETHDYATARRVWGNHGVASGQSPSAFAAAWDKYRIIDMTIGKGDQEGAAGSLYYEAPVTVTGLRRDGKPYTLSGSVTLRRVNDVDGATTEQLRWHIEGSTLKPRARQYRMCCIRSHC